LPISETAELGGRVFGDVIEMLAVSKKNFPDRWIVNEKDGAVRLVSGYFT